MFHYRIATREDLERIWDYNILENQNDPRWIRWKEKYIAYNTDGKGVSFIVLRDETPIGEGTLLLSPACDAIRGRTELGDGKNVGNVNALRIQKQYEGQGHISALIRMMEEYALARGLSALTIGVEAKETRNLAIYLHWGFTEFITSTTEDEELILYFRKRL